MLLLSCIFFDTFLAANYANDANRRPQESIDAPVRVVRAIRGYYLRVSGILAAHFFGCGSAALRPFLQSWP
ncbi:MAG: hypothetical protein DMG12_07455 [Acidobacteria bacterium]|nr:MAG: hypothetical protein DMG12_07455 [Acidobacteriota bacterium]